MTTGSGIAALRYRKSSRGATILQRAGRKARADNERTVRASAKHRTRLLCSAALALWLLAHSEVARADWLSELAGEFRGALEGGDLVLSLTTIFIAGVATSLTPCVYPMISITVSVFGAREEKSKRKGALLSLVFVLGIASLFTPLGVVAAMTGTLFGAALSNTWVLAGLGLLFVLMALSMFGAFELALPPNLQNRLGKVGGKGYRGAYGLGFVNGLIAAPCTGPVLAVLLAYIGTTRDWLFGAAALFVYAIGLGLLFFFVGTFAVTLPKSGRWLEWIKSIFGVQMLVTALYLARDILPFDRPTERSTTWIVVALVVMVVGFALGAVHRSFHVRKDRIPKSLGVTLAVLGGIGAVFWLEALPPGAKIAWVEDIDAGRQTAKKEGRPMLVDFGASWCGACGELERFTFSDPRVVAATRDRDIVPVHVDLSPGKDTPKNKAALAGYDQQGLPLVVLHRADGSEAARITGFVEPEEFLEVLDKLD